MPYGEKLAERLQATSASVIMTRVLRKAVIAATEPIRSSQSWKEQIHSTRRRVPHWIATSRLPTS